MRHISVLVGGALGALLRFWLGTAIAPTAHFPFATGVTNVVGCFGLGYVVANSRTAELSPNLRLGVTTGFFGAFTTFSTWALGISVLWGAGSTIAGWLYLGATLVLGLGAAAAGMAVGRKASPG